MKILVLTGCSEASFCSNDSLIAGLEANGHQVCIAGPEYYNPHGHTSPRMQAHEIRLPDKPFPEFYELKEFWDQLPWTPDFILQIEPHFWLRGKHIDQRIPVIHYLLDVHCSGAWQYEYLKKYGEIITAVCTAQPHLSDYFFDLGIPIWALPLAFDERRFTKDAINQPDCDIAFVGFSGITNEALKASGGAGIEKDSVGLYVSSTGRRYGKWADWSAYDDRTFFAYAERAELLLRLMDDFNVKIYKERFYDHRYEQALRSGRIGFNCSLMHDITLRVYEIMACGLPLVTDYPSYMPTDGIDRFRIREVLGWAYTYPRPLFRPYHTNFSLDYKIVKARVQEALESIEKYPLRLQGAKKEVWEHHTWRARAQRLVEMVEINLL